MSSLISLYPSLLVFSMLPISPPPPPLFFPRNHFRFIPRNLSLSMALKIRTFSAPVFEWETLLCRGEGCFATAYLRLSESGFQVCCGEGLHPAAKRYAITWSASLLRTLGFQCCSFLCFFASILLCYCLASFLILISTCPIKHYGMGD